MSCSSSLDGFFFKKDLQKWSYRHELVDDENEFIYREEWRSNGGEEIGYPTSHALACSQCCANFSFRWRRDALHESISIKIGVGGKL
ncbi:hypothetical protein LWI29_034701 [Acer saccharum]|uniref:Uncharacterized protein n=1 Tax=Acer saccharum TaxID=4024 RepID=A0AA39W0W9_ACESA|nr:hypothetical protein LWI29_034701 [Acer saccharum]KAK1575383.1 hypothetical protein Q3G72_004969 [Acer saccharum]